MTVSSLVLALGLASGVAHADDTFVSSKQPLYGNPKADQIVTFEGGASDVDWWDISANMHKLTYFPESAEDGFMKCAGEEASVLETLAPAQKYQAPRNSARTNAEKGFSDIARDLEYIARVGGDCKEGYVEGFDTCREVSVFKPAEYFVNLQSDGEGRLGIYAKTDDDTLLYVDDPENGYGRLDRLFVRQDGGILEEVQTNPVQRKMFQTYLLLSASSIDSEAEERVMYLADQL